jgi:hypothetical protein
MSPGGVTAFGHLRKRLPLTRERMGARQCK